MSKSMTEEECAAYHRAHHQKSHQKIMADPVLHAAWLARKRETHRARMQRRAQPATVPAVIAAATRAYGPWAPLFAAQEAA